MGLKKIGLALGWSHYRGKMLSKTGKPICKFVVLISGAGGGVVK